MAPITIDYVPRVTTRIDVDRDFSDRLIALILDPDHDRLDQLAASITAAELGEALSRTLAGAAREEGATWQSIADRLGWGSRQHAHSRFSRAVAA